MIRFNRLSSAALAITLSFALSSAAHAAGNQLTNPSFDLGLTGWTVVSGGAPTVVSYGSAGAPSVGVSSTIGGGGVLLRDTGGNAVVEQVVAVGSIPPGTNVKVSGYVGGEGTSQARLVVRYLNAGGTEIGIAQLDPSTQATRNNETVVMYYERVLAPAAGTASVALRVVFAAISGTSRAAADALSLELVTTPVVPTALPLNTELLVNGGFELGWAAGSPLTLTSAQGWFGTANAMSLVRQYSTTDPQAPHPNVAIDIGGGANILSDGSGVTGLIQRLDVRGNAAAIDAGNLALRASAYLGGVGTDPDSARLDIRFLNAAGVPLGSPSIGPVSASQRNAQTVVVRREQILAVPLLTRTIEISIDFQWISGAPDGLADNISAKLETPTAPAAVPLGTNLVSNGTFENGFLGMSPLQLNNPNGWEGATGNTEILQYGVGTLIPSTAFAAASGTGGLALGDGNGCTLVQLISLAGAQTLISSGQARIAASALLGGVGSDPDNAQVQIQFLTAAGAPVGGPSGLLTLGPVTAANRSNATTLLARSQDAPVPANAGQMRVSVIFSWISGSPDGLADNVSVVLYDSVAESFDFCFGDGTSATCPCGNDGGARRGCRNSTNVNGARLDMTGSTSADSVVFSVTGMPTTVACIYLQQDAWSITPVILGDGLRCIAGNLIRLRMKTSVAGASAFPEAGDPSVSVRGHVVPGIGESRYYQTWYRNPATIFCPPATSNVTNAWALLW